MKKQIVLLTTFILASLNAKAETILNGAGSTFAYPLFSQWSYKYNQESGIKINYQSIGSGGGIAQIKAKTVDFGATDAPLSNEELEASGLVQFPVMLGGVVPVVNLPGITANQLKITPEILADIYLGKISKWNDTRLQNENAGLVLPDKSIAVIRRADGSGTTWIFTEYLAQISAEWKEKVGVEKSVNWPTGIGGKGNEGVAAYVQRIQGAIGYIEYAYAVQNKLATVQLKNKEGQFVLPSIENFQAAAANADWKSKPGFGVILNNQPGATSWPITGATFTLVHKNQADAAKGKDVLKFFNWAFTSGDDIAKNLHYVALPDDVVTLITTKWTESVKGNDQATLWP